MVLISTAVGKRFADGLPIAVIIAPAIDIAELSLVVVVVMVGLK